MGVCRRIGQKRSRVDDWDASSRGFVGAGPGPGPWPVNRGCLWGDPQRSWECTGGKWGYADRDGREVIPLQFDEAHEFRGGVAAAKVGEKWGLIDRTGRLVLNPRYDTLWTCEDGFHVAGEGKKVGFIKGDGTPVGTAQYAGVRCARSGLAEAYV
jgi:hypothetical protein